MTVAQFKAECRALMGPQWVGRSTGRLLQALRRYGMAGDDLRRRAFNAGVA